MRLFNRTSPPHFHIALQHNDTASQQRYKCRLCRGPSRPPWRPSERSNATRRKWNKDNRVADQARKSASAAVRSRFQNDRRFSRHSAVFNSTNCIPRTHYASCKFVMWIVPDSMDLDRCFQQRLCFQVLCVQKVTDAAVSRHAAALPCICLRKWRRRRFNGADRQFVPHIGSLPHPNCAQHAAPRQLAQLSRWPAERNAQRRHAAALTSPRRSRP